jgi:hypothetical protein
MRGEVIHHKISHLLSAVGCQMNDEVFSTAKKEELHHLGLILELFTQLSDALTRSRSDADTNEHLKVNANSGWIDDCGESSDNSSVKQ